MNGSADRPEEPGRRLESWKEIAVYFHRDVRTVQRWELREGMPVHRHLHRDRPAIFAYTSELDAWWTERQPPELPVAADPLPPGLPVAAGPLPPGVASGRARRLLPWLAAGLVLATASAVVTFLVLRRAGTPPPVPTGPPVGRLVANLTSERAAPVRLAGFTDASDLLALPNGELYVAEPFDETVTVVDTARGQVSRRIPVAGRPSRLALAPSGDRVYVACQAGKAVAIRTADHSTSFVPGIEWARDVVATPDGRSLYFALGYAGLARLDAPSGTVERLPVVGCPMYLATDGARLYVSCQCQGPGGRPGHDAVIVFDLSSRKAVGTAQGPPQVGSTVAVSPDGAFLWVNAHDACSVPAYDHDGCPRVPASLVNVYDTSKLTLARSVPLDLEEIADVGVLPGGTRAYVAGAGLRVLETRNLAVAESMAGGMTRRPALSADGRMAWFIHGDEVVGAPTLPPSCDLPETGLLDHWPGDGAADDVWGVSHGELRGGAGFAPGVVGQAFVLDGADDEVSLGLRHNLQWPTSDATVMAWVKLRTGEPGEMTVMGRVGDGVMRDLTPRHGSWALAIARDGRFAFCMQAEEGGCGSAPDARRIAGTTRAAPVTWYHVAVTWHRGVARLFVNGVQEAQGRLEYRDGVEKHELKLGALGSASRLRGLIDEAAHYARALEPEEIAAIARMPSTPRCIGR